MAWRVPVGLLLTAARAARVALPPVCAVAALRGPAKPRPSVVDVGGLPTTEGLQHEQDGFGGVAAAGDGRRRTGAADGELSRGCRAPDCRGAALGIGRQDLHRPAGHGLELAVGLQGQRRLLHPRRAFQQPRHLAHRGEPVVPKLHQDHELQGGVKHQVQHRFIEWRNWVD